MAKTSPSSELINISYVPSALPRTALQHHGKTLFAPMKEWLARKQLPPVLLLTGQPGIGKRSIAYFLGQWILCLSEPAAGDPSGPCGKCSSCQKILSGHGVDLTEIVADSTSGPNEEGSNHTSGILKIDQFRKLKTSAGFSAHEGSYKIILIPNADRMTLQAANSVLKLLEEPPVGWIFLLTANDPTLLLPTLVSRCQIMRLKPFSAEQLQELLASSRVDPGRQKICAELAQGSWRRALDFASDEVWEQRKTILQFFKEPSSVLQPIIDWASQEPSHFDILLDLLEQNTADLIRLSTRNLSSPIEELSFHTREVVRKKGSVEAARSFWLDRAENLAQARQESLAPLNRKLLIQNLLLPWMGVSL